MATADLQQRALKLLARREHSRAELVRKLSAHGAAADVEAVVARMAELELQSDLRFAEQFVRSRGARFGARRLRQELARRGVPEETGAAAITGVLEDDELARARRVWRTRFDSAPGDAREWARQARFLQYRGFSTEVIRKALDEVDDEPA